MKVAIHADIQARPELREAVERATPVLAEALGEPASRVDISWGLRHDSRGRPLLAVTISDWTGDETAEFTPSELIPPDRVRWRFVRLWGDLLEKASKAYIGPALAPTSGGDD